jgi:hypothetical protein
MDIALLQYLLVLPDVVDTNSDWHSAVREPFRFLGGSSAARFVEKITFAATS